ncbi:hypothetical protein B0H13DRAFT_2111522 [Mycena leptocephala]|nr:hypothetical protein B0H13DRAFT_2111522 [Mycena leptocephala]
MFILPAHASPAAFPALSVGAAQTWHAQHPLRLPLALLAALLALLTLRAFFASVRALRSPKGLAVSASVSASASEKAKPAPETKRTWLGGVFSFQTLPTLTLELPTLPITLSPPPPPAMRGRHVYRGGRGVGFANPRRPEQALSARTMSVEAPLPAIYESQTPVSMAKMIMSRHTYRSPAPRRAASTSSARRPPSPEHARSASV